MQRLAAIVLAGGIAMSAPAVAAPLAFNATFSNANAPAAPGGRCAGLTVNIANGPAPFFAAGTSNFGAFTGTQSHCLDGPPPIAIGAPGRPYYDGLFTYSFGSGATLFGTYTGQLTNSGATGIINNVQNFVVTGGSGAFAGATGAFLGTGTITFAGGLPVSTLTIRDGVINAVPEPTTWAMLIAGFGATGLALRRRRAGAAPVRPIAGFGPAAA